MDTLIMNNFYLLQKKERNRDVNFYNELLHFFFNNAIKQHNELWVKISKTKNLFYKIESLMIIFIPRLLNHVYKKKS